VSEAYEKLLLRAAPPEICAAMKRFGCPEHGARWVDVLGAAMIREGLKGSAFAAKELRETVQGKAPIAIELFEDREVSISVSFENVLATRMPAIDVEPGSTEELPGSSSGSSSDGESSDE
jgi:hypothetical protein